ncbi:MAG: chromate resistance protein [Thioploca sp.]|nr:chromate resistance protein [Thioploca sp.]
MNPNSSSTWLIFIIALPTQSNTLRMRVWRTLKGLGAAVLRDGVYLLPDYDHFKTVLEQQQKEIREITGNSWLFRVDEQTPEQQVSLRSLFDRSKEYTALLKAIEAFKIALSAGEGVEARKRLRQLQRDLATLITIDFFPDATQSQVQYALNQAEVAMNTLFSPGEPQSTTSAAIIPQRDRKDYQGKFWVTREHLWIDRLASAWLIQRFIDSQARFIWSENPHEDVEGTIGFDFDGAAFTHTGALVTFEVLLASFSLDANPALQQLGKLVHYLDVGGVSMPEAAGLEQILKGIQQQYTADDDLLKEASKIFNYLYTALSK